MSRKMLELVAKEGVDICIGRYNDYTVRITMRKKGPDGRDMVVDRLTSEFKDDAVNNLLERMFEDTMIFYHCGRGIRC